MYLSMANRFLQGAPRQIIGHSGFKLISPPASATTTTFHLPRCTFASGSDSDNKNPPQSKQSNDVSFAEQVTYSSGDGIRGERWPDRDPLGDFAGTDKRFNLPGDCGMEAAAWIPSEVNVIKAGASRAWKRIEDERKFWDHLGQVPVNYQVQLGALKQHEEIQKMMEDREAARKYAENQAHFAPQKLELRPVQCPDLLRRELRAMFPTVNLTGVPLTVITFAHRTENDMSSWSPKVEDERDRLVDYFVETAKKLCQEFRNRSQWADFIDPNSGRPFYGQYTPETFFETDERYRHLGFRVNDLGCCKVISHVNWGTHAFVGSIFTSAPHDCEYLEEILRTYSPTPTNTKSSSNPPPNTSEKSTSTSSSN